MSSRASSLIDRYAAGAAVLADAAEGLASEQARAQPGPGDGSSAQLVAHLLDTDLVFGERMKRVLAETEPALLAFDENAWVERLGSQSMPVAAAVELFAAHRRWMTRILRKCSESDCARTGLQSERGPRSLAELLATVTNHVDHHLTYLYAKRANLGVARPPRYTAH